MDEAPRVRRNWPIWACKALPGFAGRPSPHSWSISRSALTGASSIEGQECQQGPLLVAANSYRLTIPRHHEVAEELHFHDPTVRPLSTPGPIELIRAISGVRQFHLRPRSQTASETTYIEEREHHDRGKAPDEALRQDSCGR